MTLFNGKLQYDDDDVLYEFNFQYDLKTVDAEKSSACILKDSPNASFDSNYQTLQNRVQFEELNFYWDNFDNIPSEFGSCTILARVLTVYNPT